MTAARQMPPSELYVQTARRGSLSRADARGHAKLTLHGVSRAMLYFLDRPHRVAGQTPLRSFVAGWGRIFGTDPPNAALDVLRRRDGRDVALELSRRPRYDAHTATLTYRVRRLDARAAGLFPSHFRDASLFIDAAPDTGYVLTVQAGDDPPMVRRFVDLEGVVVTVRDGRAPGTFAIQVSAGSRVDPDYLVVSNDASAMVGVTIGPGEPPDAPTIVRTSIPQAATWYWRPPPP